MGTPETSSKYNLTFDGETLFLNAVGQFFAVNDMNYIKQNNSLSLYPNPVSGTLYVDLNSVPVKDINISIFDITGKEVYKNHLGAITNQHISLNISDLQPGIYIIKLNDDKKSEIGKIEIR